MQKLKYISTKLKFIITKLKFIAIKLKYIQNITNESKTIM